MKEDKVFNLNGEDTGWARIKCDVEWEQGCYYFDGKWMVTKGALDVLRNGDLDAIINHILNLVSRFDGIDFFLCYEHSQKGVSYIEQQFSKKGSLLHPNEDHYSTIMLKTES